MNELTVIILIFVAGLLAMFLELFIPGIVMGLIGLIAVVGSVVYAFANDYTVTGSILAVLGVLWVPIFFVVWKGVMGRFFALKTVQKGFRASTTISEELLGKEGEAVTALHPSGVARLEGKRCDVITRGEMLRKGARVRVIEVSGNRVVVKEI